jgi:hypothetical protein
VFFLVPILGEALHADLRHVESQLQRFTEGIRLGGSLPSLVQELQRLEEQRADLHARLQHLEGLSRAAGTWDQVTLREEFTSLLSKRQTLLRGEPVQARQILRKLIVGRIRVVPEVRPEGRFYQWSGQASYGRLLAGMIGVQAILPPGRSQEPKMPEPLAQRVAVDSE